MADDEKPITPPEGLEGVSVGVEMGADGKPKAVLKVDMAVLVKGLGKSSKGAQSYKILVFLYEHSTEIEAEIEKKAKAKGLTAEKIDELREKLRKLWRLLKRIRVALDSGDSDEAKRLTGEVNDLIDEIDHAVGLK